MAWGSLARAGATVIAIRASDYCTGLMLPCERKSVEPMAAVTAPARTAAQHQSLLHFVGEGGWSDERVLGKVREMVLPAIERQRSVEAWIIDDTGFPKQGRHSVGVVRQYCGQLGKVGLGQFEGRGWRGFHHHATLCIAAYGFLISERETIPPCGPRAARFIPAAVLSDGYRPRGSAAAARASHPQLNRHHAPPPDCRPGQDSAAMPMLLSTNGKTLATEDFMMQ